MGLLTSLLLEDFDQHEVHYVVVLFEDLSVGIYTPFIDELQNEPSNDNIIHYWNFDTKLEAEEKERILVEALED
jgi:hypothetical protein